MSYSTSVLGVGHYARQRDRQTCNKKGKEEERGGFPFFLVNIPSPSSSQVSSSSSSSSCKAFFIPTAKVERKERKRRREEKACLFCRRPIRRKRWGKRFAVLRGKTKCGNINFIFYKRRLEKYFCFFRTLWCTGMKTHENGNSGFFVGISRNLFVGSFCRQVFLFPLFHHRYGCL